MLLSALGFSSFSGIFFNGILSSIVSDSWPPLLGVLLSPDYVGIVVRPVTSIKQGTLKGPEQGDWCKF
jgi:hypothetical protein